MAIKWGWAKRNWNVILQYDDKLLNWEINNKFVFVFVYVSFILNPSSPPNVPQGYSRGDSKRKQKQGQRVGFWIEKKAYFGWKVVSTFLIIAVDLGKKGLCI